jgi:hypothetical protein
LIDVGRRYPSKQDPWLSVLMWGSLFVAGFLVLFATSADIPHPLARLALAGGVVAFPALMVLPLYYEVREDELFVRCGVFRYRIPGPSIVSVAPTRNPISSPALSLDRLAIRYEVNGKSRQLLISPQEREAFLQDLQAIAPQMRLEGAEAVSR